MTETPKKILMAYIEPTPYITGLIDELRKQSNFLIDVMYLKQNLTQNWNLTLNNSDKVFPNTFRERLKFAAKLFSKNNYEFIHLAGWGERWFVFFLLIAKIRGIRVVIESDTPAPHAPKLMKRIIKRLIYPAIFSCVNLFLPGGKRQAQYIQSYGVKAKRVKPVQMTVDIESIKSYLAAKTPVDKRHIREKLQITEQNIVFLYVGRLEVYKGILDLLSAFNQVLNENVILVIAGEGEYSHRVQANTIMNPNLRYVGRVTGNALSDLYFAADAFVLPSHQDHWGLVVNEAMAAGKPVIVTDRVGCVDDLIIHQESGLIVQAEKPEALRAAIEQLATEKDKRLAMADKAQAIIANWTLENEARNICEAWNWLVTSQKDAH